MATAPRLIDPRDPPCSPTTGGNGHWRGAVRSYHGQPAADLCRRRFNRVTLGFWLGGLVLGAGGCILGACQPYRHPVAVTISVLWWGIYFGCFGASIGALVGLWTDRTGCSIPEVAGQGEARERGASTHSNSASETGQDQKHFRYLNPVTVPEEPSFNEPVQPPNAERSLILEDKTLPRKPSVLARNQRTGNRGPG
jgi:hypothetical protein